MTAAGDSPHRSKVALSAMLQALADDPARNRIAISDLLTALDDRALAALLVIFALPNVLPLPPGTSAILGTPLIFLAGQMVIGRAPWLPTFIAERSMTRADFAALIRRVGPWIRQAERLLRPRFAALALPPMEQAVGLVCLVMALALALPIPLGNMLPALTISLLALGILERDGLWVLAGLVSAIASAVVVSGVVFAMAKAAIYFFTKVLS